MEILYEKYILSPTYGLPSFINFKQHMGTGCTFCYRYTVYIWIKTYDFYSGYEIHRIYKYNRIVTYPVKEYRANIKQCVK